MENKNNNGVGVFYGVIGVATLIVAIIGATFAYFSAAANSAENAITATAANVSLGYADVKTGLKTDLIPVWASKTLSSASFYTGLDATAKTVADGTVTAFKAAVATGETVNCKDLNNNSICSVYQFTVTNNSNTSAQQVYFTMNATSQTNPISNLHYAVFKGTIAQVSGSDYKFDVGGTVVTPQAGQDANDVANGSLVIGDTAFDYNVVQAYKTNLTLAGDSKYTGCTSANDVFNALTQVLEHNATVTYTIVFWIQDTGSNQPQGGSLNARIDVTTAGSGTGVTGVLTS